MAQFAVVIPFFQRKSGILANAVNSILGQSLSGEQINIIVVDDESPVSARDELAEILLAHPGRVKLIEQRNGGPAAARNKALDNVPADAEYVAFLDSDDKWTPDHLANSMLALEGNDFYFADHYQLGQTVSAFNRAGRIDPRQHLPISGSLRRYDGDMFDQILRGNIVGTSTVVYRFRKFPALRFREEFVNAGEDYIFWLQLAKLTDKIVFSAECECTYGEGVNIFAGSGWGTEMSLTRLHYEIKFKRALPRLFSLTAAQKKATRDSVVTLRRSFVADVLHRLVHRKPLGRRLLMEHALVDPKSFLFFVPIAARMVLDRQVCADADEMAEILPD